MPDLPNPVDFAVPFFILLIAIEMLWQRRRAPEAYEPKDTLTSLAFGLGNSVIGLLAGGAIFGAMVWTWQFRLVTIPWAWWAWVLCFVLDDFAYYVFHRSAHRVRWFWASHVNHHSSQHYNLSTALRQTWTGWLALSFIFRFPLLLAGFHPAMLAFVGGVNLIYQFWIHTEVVGRMPRWFEAVMNTPSHHRVHHATNPRLPRRQLCRCVHRLGQAVRQLRPRNRCRSDPLWRGPPAWQLQPVVVGIPRMDRDCPRPERPISSVPAISAAHARSSMPAVDH